MDLCYLYHLGDSALLPLLALDRQGLPGEFGQRVHAVRLQSELRAGAATQRGMWTLRNRLRLAEYRRLTGAIAAPPSMFVDFGCDGRPYQTRTEEGDAPLG